MACVMKYVNYAVREGIALSDSGLSPYSGDVFHEVNNDMLCVD